MGKRRGFWGWVLFFIQLALSLPIIGLAIFAFVLVTFVFPPSVSGSLTSVPVGVGRLTQAAVPKFQSEFRSAHDSQCQRMPEQVFASVIWEESGWDEDAYNPSGASGLGQLMPETSVAYKVDADGNGFDVFSPADNLATSARVLCAKLDIVERYLAEGRVKGDSIALALSAYNGGEKNVLNSGGIYPKTQRYVDSVLERAASFVVAESGNDGPVRGVGGSITIDGSTSAGCPAGGRKFIDQTKNFGPIGLCDMGDYTVNANLAPSVVQMFADARAAGIPLTVTSSYRSFSSQQDTYARNCPRGSCRVPTAKPGSSQHELGLALDLGCSGQGMTRATRCFKWLIATGGGPDSPAGTTNSYGLRNFPKEAWHFSPSGR